MLLRQIEYFHTIIENNSFTLAAEKLNISQSAVSQQIKALEAELGVELFVRGVRHFTLTKAGDYFYRETKHLSHSLDHIRKETYDIGTGKKATLNVGFCRSIEGREFILSLGEFLKQYKNVSMDVVHGSHEELYELLVSNRIDAIFNDQRKSFSQAFHNMVLDTIPFYLEVSGNSSFADREYIDVSELSNETIVIVVDRKHFEQETLFYQQLISVPTTRFICAGDIEEARVHVIAEHAHHIMQATKTDPKPGSAMRRIPLYRKNKPLSSKCGLFWKRDNSGYYIECFAEIMEKQFGVENSYFDSPEYEAI